MNSTRDEFNAELPAELIALADVLSSQTGFGPEIAKTLDQGGLDARPKALGQIAPRLPEWIRGREGDLLQGCPNRKAKMPRWDSVTIIIAPIKEIERGELAQGRPSEDTGWVNGRRSFVLSDSDDNSVHLDQVRVRSGSLDLQKSVYSWSSWWYDGHGIDWLMPIVRPDGAIVGYLLYSQYSDDFHDDVASFQRDAVRGWTQLSEGR